MYTQEFFYNYEVTAPIEERIYAFLQGEICECLKPFNNENDAQAYIEYALNKFADLFESGRVVSHEESKTLC